MAHPADSPAAPPLSDQVGPCYGHADLLRWLRLDEPTVAARIARHKLLALRTGDGHLVYPAWQFREDRSTIPHLAEVLRLLASGIDDPWTWAAWLCAPDDDLDGMTSWQWLAADRNPEPVLAEAARDAANWRA